MVAACKAARLPSTNFHVLRHTWVIPAVMTGLPLLVVSQNLGHTDTRMVEKHYGHLSSETDKNEAIDELRSALSARSRRATCGCWREYLFSSGRYLAQGPLARKYLRWSTGHNCNPRPIEYILVRQSEARP